MLFKLKDLICPEFKCSSKYGAKPCYAMVLLSRFSGCGFLT